MWVAARLLCCALKSGDERSTRSHSQATASIGFQLTISMEGRSTALESGKSDRDQSANARWPRVRETISMPTRRKSDRRCHETNDRFSADLLHDALRLFLIQLRIDLRRRDRPMAKDGAGSVYTVQTAKQGRRVVRSW